QAGGRAREVAGGARCEIRRAERRSWSDSSPMFHWHSATVNRWLVPSNPARENAAAAVWAGAMCHRVARPNRRRLRVREMFYVEHFAWNYARVFSRSLFSTGG